MITMSEAISISSRTNPLGHGRSITRAIADIVFARIATAFIIHSPPIQAILASTVHLSEWRHLTLCFRMWNTQGDDIIHFWCAG